MCSGVKFSFEKTDKSPDQAGPHNHDHAAEQPQRHRLRQHAPPRALSALRPELHPQHANGVGPLEETNAKKIQATLWGCLVPLPVFPFKFFFQVGNALHSDFSDRHTMCPLILWKNVTRFVARRAELANLFSRQVEKYFFTSIKR